MSAKPYPPPRPNRVQSPTTNGPRLSLANQRASAPNLLAQPPVVASRGRGVKPSSLSSSQQTPPGKNRFVNARRPTSRPIGGRPLPVPNQIKQNGNDSSSPPPRASLKRPTSISGNRSFPNVPPPQLKSNSATNAAKAVPKLPPKPVAKKQPPAVPVKPKKVPVVPAKPSMPRPAVPHKPKKRKEFTQEEKVQLLKILKRFCGANLQLVKVTSVALAKSNKAIPNNPQYLLQLQPQLKQKKENLDSQNKDLTDDVRAAQGTTDQALITELLKSSASVSTSTAALVNMCLIITLEVQDDALSKIMLTAFSTAQQTILSLVSTLDDASGFVGNFPQIRESAESITEDHAGLVTFTAGTMGTLISDGKQLEIEAAARACILASYKLQTSLHGIISQTIVTKAKVTSCCFSQLVAVINDAASNSNFLSNKDLRGALVTSGKAIKSSFEKFMNITKNEVKTPTDDTSNIMTNAFEKLKFSIKQQLALVLAISALDRSVTAIPVPAETHLKRAEAVITLPEKVPEKPKKLNAEKDDDAKEIDNIWDEPASSEKNILFADGSVKGGNLNKLVEQLTSATEFDANYMKTFITTYRSFTSPGSLFQKLEQRYNVPESAKDQALPIQLRVCNVLKAWVELQYRDLNPKTTRQILELVKVLEVHKSYSKFAAPIRNTLNKLKEDVMAATSEIVNLTIEPKVPLCPANILFVFDEEEIAKQMSLVEQNIYLSIQSVELLNQAWNKAKLKYRAPNVLALISRSTSITMWVASFILWQPTLKQRVRALTKIINIAQHLCKLNNFNSLMAVISGLNCAAVHRLKISKAELPEPILQIYQELCNLMDCNGAYTNYRRHLHNVNPPCVPFLGVYLTDLTFIEDGNPDYITDNKLINFKKRQLVYNVIREITQYQQLPYPFPLVDNIAHFLGQLPTNEDEQLYQLSLKREPRGKKKEDIV